MSRLSRLIVLLALAAVACSSTQLPDITAPTTSTSEPPIPPPTTGESTPPTPAPAPESDRPLPGRLAALGPNGQLLVRSSAGEWQQWSADGALVSQFNWSPDGARLVWTELRRDGSTQVLVGDGIDTDQLTVERPPFFLWWHDQDEITHLGSADDEVTLVRTALDGAPAVELARAGPLFYSLSPEGRVVTHEGADELNLVTVDGAEALGRASAGFRTPAWIDDERVLALVAFEQSDALAIVDAGAATIEPLFEVEGAISFVVSPDGRRVAYQIIESGGTEDRPVSNRVAQGDEPDDAPPDVLILDLESQTATLAFVGQALWLEWSPDSRSLAGLIAANDVTWRIWDESEIVRTDPLEISPVMAEQYVPFYDQYAQSQTGWSPDSQHYAFAASVGGAPRVFVQQATVGGEATAVGDGVVVAWSPMS